LQCGQEDFLPATEEIGNGGQKTTRQARIFL
jgi:hypothetical protein